MFYSILYFLIFGSSFVSMQYINLYYKSIGLTMPQITAIIILSTLMSVISSFIIGYIFDRTDKKHFVIYGVFIVSGFLFYAISLRNEFYYVLILNVLFCMIYYSVQPLCVTITLCSLKNNCKNYGCTRLFGTIGYCVLSVIVPLITLENGLFYVMTVLTILMVIVFTIILKKDQINVEIKQREKLNIKEMFRNKNMIFFMLYVCVINITIGAYFNFFGIYFTENLGYTKQMYGVLIAVSTLSEIPFLLLSKRIMDRFTTKQILVTSGVITGVRWLLCYYFTGFISLLFIHMLHGFGFIVLMTTINVFINEKCQKKYLAQTQSIFFIQTLVFSKVFGSIIGGIFPIFFDMKHVFLLNFFICIIASVIFIFKGKQKCLK